MKDERGNPLKGKKVTVRQRTHDFKFGANIFLLDEFKEDWKNKAYRKMFKEYFNLATVPFYWNDLEPEEGKPRYAADSPKIYRRPAPDLCVDYCEKNGILPKLHCLFYDVHIPKWLPVNDEAEMRRLYEKRFSEIARRYRGRMYEFEVTNEILLEPGWTWRSVLSKQKNCVEWAFGMAEKYFPGETLVINEAQVLDPIARDGYTAKYVLQLEKLLAKGTPIDKIGIQHHIFSGVELPAGSEASDEEIRRHAEEFMNPGNILKALDILAEFGLPLELTEVTIPTLGASEEAEELQARLLENLYTLWFSHPAVASVVYWNTIEHAAYINPSGNWNEDNCRGGLFHSDITPKKSARTLHRLFHETWHTDLELTTDDRGAVEFRGFYGEYTAQADGVPLFFGLHKNGEKSIEIVL